MTKYKIPMKDGKVDIKGRLLSKVMGLLHKEDLDGDLLLRLPPQPPPQHG